MRKNIFLIASIVLLNTACNKTSPSVSGTATDPQYFKPSSITVRSMDGNGKAWQITVFKPGYNLDSTIYTMDMLDTVIQTNSILVSSCQHLTVGFDARTHAINKAQSVCQYVRKFIIRTDSSLLLYSTTNDLGNYKVDFAYVPATQNYGSPNTTQVQFSSFDDSLQKHGVAIGKWALDIPVGAGVTPYSLRYDGNTAPRDKYWMNKDTIFLADNSLTSNLFRPHRHTIDLALENTYMPFSPFAKFDCQQYFFTRSPFHCDSSRFQHGGYDNSLPSALAWQPEAELKVRYSYSADSVALSVLVAALNPGLLDPNWYYIAFYGANVGSANRVINDIADTYNITAAASADSLFAFVNGQKQLKWAGQRLKNTVFKDGAGRITRIVNYCSNWTDLSGAYQEFTISY